MLTIEDRREVEFEKYRKVYRDYPRYCNREVRIDLTREWLEGATPFWIDDVEHTGLGRRWAVCENGGVTRWQPMVLDVGCGRGEVVDMVYDLGFVSQGCEVLPEMCSDSGAVDEEGPYIMLVDGAHDLSAYAASAFDLVTCTDVLEHILEDDVPAALSEIARVARGPVLLAICHIPDRGRRGREGKPGKYGPDELHITVHPREWWEERIRKHMGAEPRALYLDRVNGNGTWFSIDCSKV